MTAKRRRRAVLLAVAVVVSAGAVAPPHHPVSVRGLTTGPSDQRMEVIDENVDPPGDPVPSGVAVDLRGLEGTAARLEYAGLLSGQSPRPGYRTLSFGLRVLNTGFSAFLPAVEANAVLIGSDGQFYWPDPALTSAANGDGRGPVLPGSFAPRTVVFVVPARAILSRLRVGLPDGTSTTNWTVRD